MRSKSMRSLLLGACMLGLLGAGSCTDRPTGPRPAVVRLGRITDDHPVVVTSYHYWSSSFPVRVENATAATLFVRVHPRRAVFLSSYDATSVDAGRTRLLSDLIPAERDQDPAGFTRLRRGEAVQVQLDDIPAAARAVVLGCEVYRFEPRHHQLLQLVVKGE